MHTVPVPLRGGAATRPRSLLVLGALLVGGFLLPAADASAIRTWCRTDPVVSINGELADIFVAAPPEAPLLVTGPNRVVVVVPKGVQAYLILNDLGFGKGTETAIEEWGALRTTDRGIEVLVKVFVPATDDEMPVRVEFAPRLVGVLWPTTAEGTANDWVTLRTEF